MIDYCLMQENEEKDVYDLIVRVFHEHVAPVYSRNGIDKFFSLVSPAWLGELNGFTMLGDEMDEDGMRFTPMQKII